MKKPKYFPQTLICCNQGYEAEPLVVKLRKVMESKEPIESVAPIVYTQKKDGVMPEYDIRTDRFDVAMEAMGKIRTAEAAQIAKSQSVPTATDGGNDPKTGQS